MTKSRTTTVHYSELPVTAWNVRHFHAYLADKTSELYGVDYAPGGGGSIRARWGREQGMLKNAQGRYGNEVLRTFIDLCHANYAPKREYPFANFTFMYSYMDRYFAQAQAAVAEGSRREDALTKADEEAARLAREQADILDLL